MITSKDLFFCYDKHMSKYINRNGIKPLTIALSPTTLNKFALYLKSNNLQQTIDNYNNLNK